MDQARAPFGRLLRQWRQQRQRSQLDLALQADVSTRHLSWLETGRAQPSRAMVLRLAEQLDVPLRERNALLVAAGFSPLYAERALADPGMRVARDVLQRLLDAHEPWPAMAVDRHWHLAAANRMIAPLISMAAPHLLRPPINVLRLSLHPEGLAPQVANLAAWRDHVLARLQRQAQATGDPMLRDLLQELRELPLPAGTPAAATPILDQDVAVPLTFRSPVGVLNFITTVTVFGAPHDVTVSELAVETLLPADETTAAALRTLRASLD
jgi:transcriptional regulator with XRE-family HTH domain